jgi:hypothetical protein
MTEKSRMPLEFLEVVGAVAGGALAYLLTRHMPGFASAFVCAAIIVLLSAASSRVSHPTVWWAGIGAVAGSVLGTAVRLGELLAGEELAHRTEIRYLIVGTLVVAGLLAGIFRGKDVEQTKMPKPAEFLKRASALTVVAYALLVTCAFPSRGLDKVRALSSRLSTMTTIVATSLAVPGWVGFLIGKRWGERLRERIDPDTFSRKDRSSAADDPPHLANP